MFREIEIKDKSQIEKINRLACDTPFEVWLSSGSMMLDARSLLGLFALIGKRAHVVVEDDVLVGANAVVIEGVHVGKGAVVAAGAVVIEDVPENAVVAGCPARVIKMKDEGTTQKTALEAALRNL